jgi:hypothetical protein
VYSDLATALAPFLAAPGQVWLLTFEASASALLLLLAGLHTGWLLRWLRNQSSPAQNAGWNTELQSMAATE